MQTHPLRYRALMLSILHLARSQPVLRTASLSQALLFAGFNAFWATLALLVEGPPFGLTAAGAGLFGVIGVCGAFVAPISGRFTDRRGRSPSSSAAACWSPSPSRSSGRGHLVARRGGARRAAHRHRHERRAHRQPDAGLRAGPGARGRINTVLFTTLFVFGALGAYAGSQAFLLVGWPGVCAVGLAFSALAVIVAARDPHPPGARPT